MLVTLYAGSFLNLVTIVHNYTVTDKEPRRSFNSLLKSNYGRYVGYADHDGCKLMVCIIMA